MQYTADGEVYVNKAYKSRYVIILLKYTDRFYVGHGFMHRRKMVLVVSIQWVCSSDIASSYYFHPSKVTEHVTSRVSQVEFKTK